MYKLAALAVAAVVAAAAFSVPAIAKERGHGGHKMKHGDNHRGGDRHRRRGGIAIGIGDNGVYISKKRKHRRGH